MGNFDISERTLFIFPHLDDEFALAPLIKKVADISQENCHFLYLKNTYMYLQDM